MGDRPRAPTPQDSTVSEVRLLQAELENAKGTTVRLEKAGRYSANTLSIEQSRHLESVLRMYLDDVVSERQVASLAEPELLLRMTKSLYISDIGVHEEELKNKEDVLMHFGNSLQESGGDAVSLMRRPFDSRLSLSTRVRATKAGKMRKTRKFTDPADSDGGRDSLANTEADTVAKHEYDFTKVPEGGRFEDVLPAILEVNKELASKIKRLEEDVEKAEREKGDLLTKITDSKFSVMSVQLSVEAEKCRVSEEAKETYDRHGYPWSDPVMPIHLETRKQKAVSEYEQAVQSYCIAEYNRETAKTELEREIALLRGQYEMHVKMTRDNQQQ